MFLLYHKSTSVTGRKLAAALGLKCGRRGDRVRPNDTLLRWGSSIPKECGHEINAAAAIQRAADKLRAFAALRVAGVRVPDHHPNDWRALPAGRIIGRSRWGSGGRGIVVYDSPEDTLPGHEMYVQFVPSTREYRLHVVKGEVIRVQRKYHETGVDDQPIRNHTNGYVFKAPQRQLHQRRLDMAVKAVDALGLDFGAVDMLIDAEGQEWVLEVNTAPACSPLTMSLYVEKLRGLL